ncbi:MAG: hypothetical protein ACSHXK_05530 [Oceanococcus sp.]
MTILLMVSRVVGAHAHGCSDGNLDCLQDTHADAIVHVSESCADESCVDTKVEVADGVLVKLLDLDDGEFLAVIVAGLLGLLLTPRIAPLVRRSAPRVRAAAGLHPPARAPPLTL